MVCNRGSSYKFILNQLPYATDEIFVDASSSWGIGGFQGDRYFLVPNIDIEVFQILGRKYNTQTSRRDSPQRLPIAYIELLAAMIGVVCFIPFCRNRIVRLNSDNTDAVAWLQKSRCSAGMGFRMLAVIELYKLTYNSKISARYIKRVANKSADSLSRGVIPGWLVRFGKKCEINLDEITGLLNDPFSAWKKAIYD